VRQEKSHANSDQLYFGGAKFQKNNLKNKHINLIFHFFTEQIAKFPKQKSGENFSHI
jgi:hypothetical protein